jgi:anti-anti-sigma regulatory factor
MSVATRSQVTLLNNNNDPTQGGAQQLQIEKITEGPITCVKFNGIINEKFEGKKTAAAIKAKKLVLDLGGVVRVSSFGVREWLDFIGVVGRTMDEFYLINCSPKVMNQLNLVTDFTGKGLVFSFYAPYRCDYCETELLVLLNCDRDHEALKKLKAPERACETCGNAEFFDDEPITYFSYIANQREFELDQNVGNFLVSKLGYQVGDLSRRIQAEKVLEGRNTLMKLAGNLDAAFPGSKLAEGIEGTVVVDLAGVGGVDPAGAAEFRKFVSLMKPHAERIYLNACESAFLERTLQPEDLGGKVQVISLSLPFTCDKCRSTTRHMIDVAEHHSLLKIAMAPQQKCPECRGPAVCVPADATRTLMPSLPMPEVSPDLKRFIKKATKPKKDKKKADADAGAAVRRSALIVLPIALAAVGGMSALVYVQQQRSEEMVKDSIKVLNEATKKKPAWITSDIPFSSYCTDLANRISCVGVSSYLPSKEAAKIEAANAALEALANTITLRIDTAAFRTNALPVFRDVRQLALGDLEDARTNPAGADFERTAGLVRNAHRDVSAALRRTGGAAVPAQIADWYWEEYERLDGEGTEFRAFVGYDLSPNAIDALVATYANEVEVAGLKVVTTFPSIAWKFPDGAFGAMLVEVQKGPMAKWGLAPGDVFLAVGDEQVRDSADFVAKMKKEFETRDQRGGKMKFVVTDKTGAIKNFDGPIGSQPSSANK